MTKPINFSAPLPHQLTDQVAREAALNIQASCIVEAPAGSGKTGLLMQRFLKLLGGSGVTEPEQVLAITFTNKATVELRDRVLTQLVQAQQQTPLSDNALAFENETRALAAAVLARDSELHWGILTSPERLNIRTIDSVCAEIAGSLPLLSQSGGANRPVTDATPLYRLAAQRTLMQLGGDNRHLHDALHTVMLHRDASFLDCETLLSRMLARREQWGELVPLGSEFHDDDELDRVVRPRLERALEKIVCDGLSHATSLMPSGALAELAALAAQLGLNPGYNGGASPIAFCSALDQPPVIAGDYLDHWKALIHLLLKASDDDWRATFNVNHVGFEMSKAQKAALKSIIDSIQSPELLQALAEIRTLPPARYPNEQWQVARALFHVLRHALAELKVLFAERGECDFTEVALAARTALAEEFSSQPNTLQAIDLALSAGSRIHHLLVDEMQDTSAAQYDLIQQLTRSWDGSSQTLFLVGDPKQSIYLFRQARVERFLRTMREQRLGDIRLRPLHLTANFRSQAALIDGFNHTFDLLFPTPNSVTSAEIPFVVATAVRPLTFPAAINWRTTVLSNGDSSQRYEQQQAVTIRETIQSWISRPLPPERTQTILKPWRIAILARARNHLAPIVAELKRSNISFRAVDIDPLNQCQEVLDALALTRALLHPADRAAWLAVLHAPWCGLSLADLLALTGEPNPDANTPAPNACTPISILVEERSQLLSTEGRVLLDRAWPTLATALSTLGTSALSTHVERTWRSLGADGLLNDSQRTNVFRFLALLREMEPEVDLALLHSRLQQLFAEPASGSPVVDLLTIHKAKGLEWDVVLIPSLHRTAPRNSFDLLNWLELDQSGTSEDSATILLAPIQSKGEPSTQLNKWLNRIKELRERAEEKRLFYVACTRAREELHLFASCELKKDGTLASPPPASLLKACWPAAEPHFLTTQTTSTPATIITMPLPVAAEPLALAAAAELTPQTIQRLPLNFDPLARFNIPAADRLLYPAADTLPQAPAFDRPEGSFAVRAFGNVVHRFLQFITTRLETGLTPDTLLTELAQWQPRLFTVLRAEGLAPNVARRDSARALAALQQSLTDPDGRWLLSPHNTSSTEQPLTSGHLQDLRADRTFFAGPTPHSNGASHLWIVDFKTSTQRSLSIKDFEAAELAKYRAQLETYARIRCGLLPPGTPIQLALYYPLLPHLIHWESRID